MTFLDTQETRTVGTETAESAPEPIPDLERGSLVDRYVILEQIGKGGMGVVYTAYDPELDRQIALKILRTRRDDENEMSKRLKREAQALAQLSHPNVIAIHDVGVVDGDVFLAMEYVRGPNLRTWLRDEKPARHELLDVFIQAGRGLAAAHSAGLIHRDFKPDNVIVGVDGRVRVLDFGLARAADAGAEQKAQESLDEILDTSSQEIPSISGVGVRSHSTFPDGTTVERTGGNLLHASITHEKGVQGTPAYMAPEQFLGSDVDSRADQYSFCSTLFEALCGFRPIKTKNLGEIRKRALAGKLEAIPADRRVPRHLQRVLERGLMRDPDARFPNMDALLRELERDPAARVRRMAMAVALALIVALVSWILLRGQSDGAAPCQRVAQRLDTVWNAQSREALKQRFLASERAYAGETFERTREVLDEYARDWKAMRIDTCEATHVRREQSASLMDLRMQCLNRRLARMEVLIEVLSVEPDENTLDNAVDAAYDLPTLDQCEDAELLTALTPLPTDPDTRQRVEILEQRLSHTQALESTGEYVEALGMVENLLAQSRALGYEPLMAETLYLSGVLLERTGEFQKAEQNLLAAAKLAAQVHDDALSVAVWTELVRVVGHGQGKFEKASLLGHMAEAAIQRIGDFELARADLFNHLGSTAFAANRFGEALAYHEQALTIRRRLHGPEHPDVAESLSHLGTVLHNQGKTTEATKKDLEAHAIRVGTLGPNHPKTGDSHNNLGVALAAQKKYAEAHEHYLRAREIFMGAYGPESPQVGTAEYNLGEFFWFQEQPERALSHHENALVIFEKTYGRDHPFTAYPLTGLGMAHVALGQPDKAEDLLSRAFAIRDSQRAEPASLALTRFYLQRAIWESGAGGPSVKAEALAAYEAYIGDANQVEAEAAFMKTWLDALPP